MLRSTTRPDLVRLQQCTAEMEARNSICYTLTPLICAISSFFILQALLINHFNNKHFYLFHCLYFFFIIPYHLYHRLLSRMFTFSAGLTRAVCHLLTSRLPVEHST